MEAGEFIRQGIGPAGGRVEITTSAAAIAAAAPDSGQDTDGSPTPRTLRGLGSTPTSRTKTSADGAPRSFRAAIAAADVPPPPRITAEGAAHAGVPHGVDDARDVGVVPDPADGRPVGFEHHGVYDSEDAGHPADLVNLRNHGGLERHGDGQSAPALGSPRTVSMKAGSGTVTSMAVYSMSTPSRA